MVMGLLFLIIRFVKFLLIAMLTYNMERRKKGATTQDDVLAYYSSPIQPLQVTTEHVDGSMLTSVCVVYREMCVCVWLCLHMCVCLTKGILVIVLQLALPLKNIPGLYHPYCLCCIIIGAYSYLFTHFSDDGFHMLF